MSARVDCISELTRRRAQVSVGIDPDAPAAPRFLEDSPERIARVLFLHDVDPDDIDSLLEELKNATANSLAILGACPNLQVQYASLHGLMAQAMTFGVAYGKAVAARDAAAE